MQLLLQSTVRLVTSRPTTRKVGLVSQISETDGMANDQVVPHSTVRSFPQTRLGGVVSTSVNDSLPTEIFPHALHAALPSFTVKLVGQLTVRLVTSRPTTRKVGLVSQISKTV